MKQLCMVFALMLRVWWSSIRYAVYWRRFALAQMREHDRNSSLAEEHAANAEANKIYNFLEARGQIEWVEVKPWN